ncbi:MAG TPA: ATP-binding protein [Aggregatilineales bacterium]|nr:ATP-binding protein [Aggregatilineales bacterium]
MENLLGKLGRNMSQVNSPTSSNIDSSTCRTCGSQDNICESMGYVRYDVPVGDPRFGKMFRCPNYRVEYDTDRQERIRQLSSLASYHDKSFENFVITPNLDPAQQESLELAFAVSKRYSEELDGWLLLEGTYGCGKTHLAAAVGNKRLLKGDVVLFITVPDLLDHLRSAFGPTSELSYDETFDRIKNSHILILDDLGAENSSSWAQEKLYQLLNHRYVHQLPTIITTNINIDTFDPRIRSRLLDNNLIKRRIIAAPDYRTSTRNEYGQLSDLGLYADMTFGTFDVQQKLTFEERPNLEKALEIAKAYSRNPEGWLTLTGPYATGKTHLAAAIAQELRQRAAEVSFVTIPDLLDYFKVAFSPDSSVKFEQRFQIIRNAPLLVLDDLMGGGSPWAQEKLFQILDYRYVTRRSTVITTSVQIEKLPPRIQSRLKDKRRCLIFAITAPDYPSRMNRKA